MVLDTLTHIQDSIASLEARYHGLETTLADSTKKYAEIVKSNSSTDSKIERKTQQRNQREALREERAKFGVMLSTKNTSAAVQTSILNMAAKAIADRCQQAINCVYVNHEDSPRIIGIIRLARSIRL